MFADLALWVQSATRQLGLEVLKCKGTDNHANIGTKPHKAEMHAQLCRQVGLRRLGGDLGAVREVEVNAVIEKMGRMNHEAQPRGKTPSSLTLSAAISAVCLAIQAQQVEAAGELNPVPEVSVEKDYSYMVMITLLFISWLGMFLLGCAVGYGHGNMWATTMAEAAGARTWPRCWSLPRRRWTAMRLRELEPDDDVISADRTLSTTWMISVRH